MEESEYTWAKDDSGKFILKKDEISISSLRLESIEKE